MTGYELISFIADNGLGEAEVVVEGEVNVQYNDGDEAEEKSGEVSECADEAKRSTGGTGIIITFRGDLDLR